MSLAGTDRLMEVFGFTPSDLAHNRRGMLSPEQEVRTGQQRRRLKRRVRVIGLVLLAIAAIWVAAFLAAFSQPQLQAVGILAAAIGGAIFGLPALVAMYLGLRRAPKITLEKVEGRTRVARVEHTGRTNNSSYTYVNTEMHMGDRIFVVPDPAFSELEDGADYAVYAWKGTGEIFSLEKL